MFLAFVGQSNAQEDLIGISNPIRIAIGAEENLIGYSAPVGINVGESTIDSSKQSVSGVSNVNSVKIPVTTNEKPVNTSAIEKISVPETQKVGTNTFALIIGNEDYQSYQTGLSTEQNVEYAISDSRLFKEICRKTLGIPSENIIYIENASFVKIKQAISQIELVCKYAPEKPTIVFYYSGHGLPDEQTKVPYIIPVDVSGSSLDYAISLPDIYKSLTKYPTNKVIVLLDACFTGGARNSGLVASRGVKVIPKQEELVGNMVVFSSSSADQPSKAYQEKQHGLFTYYLTKKLIDSKGDITLGELDEYLFENVPIKSVLINKSEQVPQTNVSSDIQNSWKSWKFD